MFVARRTGNALLDQMFRSLETELKTLAFAILGKSVVTKAIAITDTQVSHGLGRKPRGYLVVGQTASASLFDGTASDEPETFVNLKASAAASFNLIFF